MGFRFRKSINLGGGVKVNVSKSGIGYSVGTKGARITKSAKGSVYGTFSAPGTGLSYRTKSVSGKQSRNSYVPIKNNTGGLIETTPLYTSDQAKILQEINEIIVTTEKKLKQLKSIEFNIKSIKYCNIVWAMLIITIPMIFVYKKWRGKLVIKKDKLESELESLKNRCKDLELLYDTTIASTVNVDSYDDNELGYELNKKGMDLEKQGLINDAIKYYELSVENNFDGTHPYDRLAILYRKKKDYYNEIIVIEKAIYNFEKIQNIGHRDVSVTINKFKERLEKANKLQQKSIEANL